MNPLTRILGISTGILLVLVMAMGYWLRADERALGAVPAQISAARLQDANTASDVARKMILDRAKENDVALHQAVKSQARADLEHENTMLGIQQRQDAAKLKFVEATYDAQARQWANQPVPGDYVAGMCSSLGGSAPGCGQPAAGGDVKGPGPVHYAGPDGRDGYARRHHHRQPASRRNEAAERFRQL